MNALQLLRHFFRFSALMAVVLVTAAFSQQAPQSIGRFEGVTGVGTLLHAGSAEYSASTKTYVITGSGENMWAAVDAFQFVWTKVTASNVSLTADISMLSGGEEHRKAALMIRQSLDADSAYADVALHGSGLTSLQFRDQKGAATHEIESNVSAPSRLKIEKRGDRFYMWLGDAGGALQFAGGSTRVPINGTFYVGLAVCAHNKDAIFKAAFANVELSTSEVTPAPVASYSAIETIAVSSTDALVSYVSREPIDAVAWSHAPADLVYRSGGLVKRVAFAGGSPQPATPDDQSILADAATSANRFERPSPDGHLIASLLFPSASAVELPDQELELLVTSAPNTGTVSATPGGITRRTLAKFVGDKHSLGVQPWSPDGRRIVFVSHQAL